MTKRTDEYEKPIEKVTLFMEIYPDGKMRASAVRGDKGESEQLTNITNRNPKYFARAAAGVVDMATECLTEAHREETFGA